MLSAYSPVNLSAIFLQQNNYTATFSMSNFALSPFARGETVATQRQHHPLQEHLLPLSNSGKVWKSCWIMWRASTSISSTVIPVLQINTDFLIQQAARRAELHNCLKAWREQKSYERRKERAFSLSTTFSEIYLRFINYKWPFLEKKMFLYARPYTCFTEKDLRLQCTNIYQ